MNLMDLLSSEAGQGAVAQIARQVGIDERTAATALQAVLPAVSRGIRNNAAKPGGLDALAGALGNGGHDRYLERPDVLAQPGAVADGNAILGHIFGDKDVSRNVAGHAAQQTGVGSDLIKQMLPLVAAVAMGMLSKQTQKGRQIGAVPEVASAPAGGGGALDILNQVLDADGDGSAVDDLLNLAQRFF